MENDTMDDVLNGKEQSSGKERGEDYGHADTAAGSVKDGHADTDVLLKLEHISKIYGDLKALNDVSMTVRQGEWLSVVGSSGSGKTTLMNIIGCLDTPSEGTMTMQGRRIEDLGERQLTEVRKNVIGLVFQKFYLIPHLTAIENVMVAQYYHSVVDREQAMQALDGVGLKDRAHHLPNQLSGGEQQRVCIARALINEPQLILADEPTGNLDEHNERIVLDLFGKLHEQGTTLIVVTHDSLVASCGQREIMLNHGVLVKERDTAGQVQDGDGETQGDVRRASQESGRETDLPIGFEGTTKAAKR